MIVLPGDVTLTIEGTFRLTNADGTIGDATLRARFKAVDLSNVVSTVDEVRKIAALIAKVLQHNIGVAVQNSNVEYIGSPEAGKILFEELHKVR